MNPDVLDVLVLLNFYGAMAKSIRKQTKMVHILEGSSPYIATGLKIYYSLVKRVRIRKEIGRN